MLTNLAIPDPDQTHCIPYHSNLGGPCFRISRSVFRYHTIVIRLVVLAVRD